MTSREYMREVTQIEAKWLVEMAPTFYKAIDPREISKRKQAEKILPLFNRGEGKDDWRISKMKAEYATARQSSFR